MDGLIGGWMKREPFICQGCGATNGAWRRMVDVVPPAVQETGEPRAGGVVLDVLLSCHPCDTRVHMRWYDRGDYCLVRLEPYTPGEHT
jgi:hypothetical protein